ncbi:hypothetical protein [Streptomyces sp. NPDC051310]|uniref:hypothetical protein n=1 Tax=Streptomyces sp. NPDC051310 TaxID=3365649 RepID=UPI0037AE57F3
MDQQEPTRASSAATRTPRRPSHATERFEGPTTLYRMYDAADRLLYIGITCNQSQRWEQHRDKSAWWPLVVRKELTSLPNRQAALAAERAAILAEEPAHNVSGNPRAGRRDVHLVLKGSRAEVLAALAKAERVSVSQFVMRLIDARLDEATGDSDPDMDEALRRVRAGGAR